MAVTHKKVSAKADGADSSLVLPSDWNDDHDVAIAHADLSSVTADQHHAQAHTHPGEGAVTVTHASTTGQTANDHHAQSHTHASHTGIGADDHHTEVHSHSNGTSIAFSNGVLFVTGDAAPEGSVTAPAGSLYLRTTGLHYVKTSGSGNTGWTETVTRD